MSLRKISSLTSLTSFLVMILTSIILFIVPHGRVAYWADWRLWGLSKDQWGAIHINVGLLFLLSLCVHVYYNWKPIVLYLKTKTKQLRIFTAEFNIALLITLVCIVGTHLELPPFSSFLNISEAFKESAIETYGVPPYGHAELSSVTIFTRKMGLDITEAIDDLSNAGYPVDDPEMTLKELAAKYDVSPKHLAEAMGAPNDMPMGQGRGQGRQR